MNFKFGTVEKLNHKKSLAKVAFREEQGRDGGGKFSVWLPVMQARTKTRRSYMMPSKGEIVPCLLDESWETGVVLGAVYSEENEPTSRMDEKKNVIQFDDGTVLSYDENEKELFVHTAGTLKITVAGDATINVDGTADIDATTMNLTATTMKIEATTLTISATTGTMDGVMDNVMKKITNDIKTTFNTHIHIPNATPLPSFFMTPTP